MQQGMHQVIQGKKAKSVYFLGLVFLGIFQFCFFVCLVLGGGEGECVCFLKYTIISKSSEEYKKEVPLPIAHTAIEVIYMDLYVLHFETYSSLPSE